VQRSKNSVLLNHLVGGGKQRGRHCETKRLGDFQIDDQLKFGPKERPAASIKGKKPVALGFAGS
jgi:hypothetical protein